MNYKNIAMTVKEDYNVLCSTLYFQLYKTFNTSMQYKIMLKQYDVIQKTIYWTKYNALLYDKVHDQLQCHFQMTKYMTIYLDKL